MTCWDKPSISYTHEILYLKNPVVQSLWAGQFVTEQQVCWLSLCPQTVNYYHNLTFDDYVVKGMTIFQYKLFFQNRKTCRSQKKKRDHFWCPNLITAKSKDSTRSEVHEVKGILPPVHLHLHKANLFLAFSHANGVHASQICHSDQFSLTFLDDMTETTKNLCHKGANETRLEGIPPVPHHLLPKPITNVHLW